jgi:transketolase
MNRNKLQIRGPETTVDMADPAKIWKEYGWNVIELKDGNDISKVLDAFTEARAVEGKPTVIISNTIMGKGVSFMEKNSLAGSSKWHGTPPTLEEYRNAEKEINKNIKKLIVQGVFDLESYIKSVKTKAGQKNINTENKVEAASDAEIAMSAKKPYRGRSFPTRMAFGEYLSELSAQNEKIVGICADVSDSVGFKAMRESFPDRFFDVGVSEQLMASIAAGLASCGKRPFIAG